MNTAWGFGLVIGPALGGYLAQVLVYTYKWTCIKLARLLVWQKRRDGLLSFSYSTLLLSACWKVPTNILQGVSFWEVDPARSRYSYLQNCLQYSYTWLHGWLIGLILQVSIFLTLCSCVIACCHCSNKLYMDAGTYSFTTYYHQSSFNFSIANTDKEYQYYLA